MLFVFIYLTQTENSTKLTKDIAIVMLVIAATYIAAIIAFGAPFLNGYAVLNPAVSVMICFTMLFNGNADGLAYSWIYAGAPVLGALIGVFFHEFFIKKMQANVNEVE